MKIEGGYVELEGVVEKLEKSLIPNVVIAHIRSDDVLVRMDLTKQLLVFNEGDKVRVTISKDKPEYEFGKDFVGWGYVVALKHGGGNSPNKLLISIWGYLLIIESSSNELLDAFSPMDKVYVKISKI